MIDAKPVLKDQSEQNSRLRETIRFSDKMQTEQSMESTRVMNVNKSGLSALQTATYSADLKNLNEQAKKAWQ